MEVTAENVEKALQQFYQNTSSQTEIDRWLTLAQVSPQAWQFCWQLLQQDKSAEVQFFGANCLHVKISRYWFELPKEQYGALRSQLFDHIVKYAGGPKMVLTRLCVALSAFAMQTVPQVWPEAVKGILTTFQQSNLPNLHADQVGLLVLEILTVLPEEFSTTTFPQHRKGVVRHELKESTKLVLPLLVSVFHSSTQPLVYDQALHCLSSWFQFGVPIDEAEAVCLHAFQALHNPALFDTAVDALTNMFSVGDNHYRYPNTVKKLLPHIVQTEGLLQKAISNKDQDTCQGLVRFIVTAADSSTKVILNLTMGNEQERQLALALVKLVMECTAIPGHFPTEECSSDLAFGFWYNLQDEIVASGKEKFPVLGQVYVPIYMNLIDILLQKSQYPTDEEYESWDSEEKEKHRCYRQDIADTLMYAYNLLNASLLGNLCRLLQSVLQKSTSENVKWQEVEAVLFAVTSIAESVDLEENVFLPSLFQMLSSVPCTNYKLISMALYLIGSYAEWISGHPEVLSHVLPLMLQGLKDPTLAQPATLSLKEVVRENQDHLMPFVAQILSSSKEALDTNTLKPRDAFRLMGCLGYVLSVLPVSDIMDYLNILLAPHIDELQQLASVEQSAGSRAGIILKVSMLSWMFRSLNIYWMEDKEEEEGATPKPKPQGPQPVLLVIQKTLPVFQSVLRNWVNDVTIVEEFCDMFRHAIRTLMNEFGPLSNDITQLTIDMFNASPHAVILDLAKQLLTLFASDESQEGNGSLLFISVCAKCLALYEAGIREHPDVAENFMNFLLTMGKKNKKLFLLSECNILGLYQAGVISLALPEGRTVRAACTFLSELLAMGERNPRVTEVIKTHGNLLMEQLIRSIAGESPRTVIDSTADVFMALNKHHFEVISSWLHQMTHQDGFPTPRSTRHEKEQFVSRILKERVNKRRLKETISEYTLMWRGLIGTEYAAQTVSILDP